ncbi:MAG: hypothetical protein AB8F78_03305 [Saprospiraceae bacterium]
MQLRYCFFFLFTLVLIVGCNREDDEVVTIIEGELPPADSLNSTTSLAGTVKIFDGSTPGNTTAEVLYGDFVVASQLVNTGDGSWNFDDIPSSGNPNVLVRVTSPGYIPSIRSLPNSDDIVHYSNFVLLERGRTDFVTPLADYTETNGLLTVTIPANSYANHEDDQGVEISLNAYAGGDINSINNTIAAPFLVDDGSGIIKTLSNPTIYALVVTGASGELLKFDDSQGRDIELSSVSAGPVSIIYVLNQETGYWENLSTPDRLLSVKQFGYFAVAQVSNAVRVTGRIEQPDGTAVPGATVAAHVSNVNGAFAFDLTATNGNGEYLIQFPVGSTGQVFLDPAECGQTQYQLSDPVLVDVDLGTFTVGAPVSTLIEGLVEGCIAGVGSTEDMAIEITSAGFGRETVPVASDGTFSFVRDICQLENVTLVPTIQSGQNVGRQGESLVVTDGDPLQGLRLKYCDTLVSDAIMFMSFEGPTVLSTDPVGTTIGPNRVEIVGQTMNPVGEMRWTVVLPSNGDLPVVRAHYTGTDETFGGDSYVDVIDFTYDGIELFFSFVDAPGVQTDLSDGSMSTRLARGSVRVKVD